MNSWIYLFLFMLFCRTSELYCQEFNKRDSFGNKIGNWVENSKDGGLIMGDYKSYDHNEKNGYWSGFGRILYFEQDWLMEQKAFDYETGKMAFHQYLNKTTDTLTVVTFRERIIIKKYYLIDSLHFPFHKLEERDIELKTEVYNIKGKLKKVFWGKSESEGGWNYEE